MRPSLDLGLRPSFKQVRACHLIMSRFEKILSIIGYRSRNNYIQVRGARPRHSVPNQCTSERVLNRFQSGLIGIWSKHYLFGARFRANLLHGHAWKACRYHSFQRSNWKRAPEASGSFLSCGFEPKFICLCANHYLLFFRPKIILTLGYRQRQKKLKLNFTNQWRFRKKASQLGKESSITSHS